MTFAILCDGTAKHYHEPVLVAELPDVNRREPIRMATYPLPVALRGTSVLTPMEAALSVFDEDDDTRLRYTLRCPDADCGRDTSLSVSHVRVLRRHLEAAGVHQATLGQLEYLVRHSTI